MKNYEDNTFIHWFLWQGKRFTPEWETKQGFADALEAYNNYDNFTYSHSIMFDDQGSCWEVNFEIILEERQAEDDQNAEDDAKHIEMYRSPSWVSQKLY